MSRIGKTPVPLPSGVTVKVAGDSFEVHGPKGSLRFPLFPEVAIRVEDGVAYVERTGAGGERQARAYHGLVRAHLANMVQGVSEGFTKVLEIVGTGWNAKVQGNAVELQIGFCHPVVCTAPEGVTVTVPTPNQIVISGPDKQKVGQFAANVRRVRPPEPYKGKGIRYQGEEVRRKVGKSHS